MATTAETLQQGQRVRVVAPGVPEFATARFVTPADADGIAAVFLADDAGTVHEVRVGGLTVSRRITSPQCLAVLVHSPRLLDTESHSLKTMALVDGACRYLELASQTR